MELVVNEVEVYPPTLPVIEKRIVLTLTEEEAAALFAICGSISGSSEKDNPRDVITSKLWNTLNKTFGWYLSTGYIGDGWRPITKKYKDNIVQGMVIKGEG